MRSLTTTTKHFFASQFFPARSLTPNSPFLPVARPHRQLLETLRVARSPKWYGIAVLV
ncbi:MAG: hypothetical protein ACYTXI_39725 [Nostoc sp.]